MSYDSSREQINNDQNESNATRAFIPVIASIGRKLAAAKPLDSIISTSVFYQNITTTIIKML